MYVKHGIPISKFLISSLNKAKTKTLNEFRIILTSFVADHSESFNGFGNMVLDIFCESLTEFLTAVLDLEIITTIEHIILLVREFSTVTHTFKTDTPL